MAHIPSWLPGGEYKQKAAECRALAEEVLTSPVEYVMENMVIIIVDLQFGINTGHFIRLLEQQEDRSSMTCLRHEAVKRTRTLSKLWQHLLS